MSSLDENQNTESLSEAAASLLSDDDIVRMTNSPELRNSDFFDGAVISKRLENINMSLSSGRPSHSPEDSLKVVNNGHSISTINKVMSTYDDGSFIDSVESNDEIRNSVSANKALTERYETITGKPITPGKSLSSPSSSPKMNTNSNANKSRFSGASPSRFSGASTSSPSSSRFSGASPSRFSGAPTSSPSRFSGVPVTSPSRFSGAPASSPSRFSGAPASSPSRFSGAPASSPSSSRFSKSPSASRFSKSPSAKSQLQSFVPLPLSNVVIVEPELDDNATKINAAALSPYSKEEIDEFSEERNDPYLSEVANSPEYRSARASYLKSGGNMSGRASRFSGTSTGRNASPVRTRTPSPVRTRALERSRTPSPVRTRALVLERTPSPVRTRALERSRTPSPVRTRALERSRSPSPVRSSLGASTPKRSALSSRKQNKLDYDVPVKLECRIVQGDEETENAGRKSNLDKWRTMQKEKFSNTKTRSPYKSVTFEDDEM